MRRNNRPNFFLMIVALLACARADLRAQAKPEMKAEDAPLRVALAGLVHGHAFGFFDQFQHRTDLQIVGIAESDQQLAAQFARKYGLQPRSEEHTSELQSQSNIVCRLLLEKKKQNNR